VTDTLLASSLWICRYYGMPQTASSFLAGLPVQPLLAPHNAKRAFDALDTSMREVKGPLDETFDLLFPVVYELIDGRYIVVKHRQRVGDDVIYDIYDPLNTEDDALESTKSVSWHELKGRLTDRFYIYKKVYFADPNSLPIKLQKRISFGSSGPTSNTSEMRSSPRSSVMY